MGLYEMRSSPAERAIGQTRSEWSLADSPARGSFARGFRVGAAPRYISLQGLIPGRSERAVQFRPIKKAGAS